MRERERSGRQTKEREIRQTDKRERERSYRQLRERSEKNLCLIVFNQKIKVLISFQQGKINAITMEENSLILAIPFM